MPRPLPIIPRGPRRPRLRLPRLLFACPRIAPDDELRTLAALIKPAPFRRDALAYRSGEQAWPDAADRLAITLHREISDRLGMELPPQHLSAAGEYHLVMDFPAERQFEVLAYALALSRRLGELWFILDRLCIRNAALYRRRRGHVLSLAPTSHVHLPRALRAALRDVL